MFSSCNWRPASIRFLLICATVISCVGGAMSQSQSNAADLQGSVRDPQGAAVRGATVTARNLATSVSRDATSNDEGVYQILGLPPGNYEITIQAPGYDSKRYRIPVLRGKKTVQDFVLEPAADASGGVCHQDHDTSPIVEGMRKETRTARPPRSLRGLLHASMLRCHTICDAGNSRNVLSGITVRR